MNSDVEVPGTRQIFPPRPTSAPHKVRPVKSIDDVPILRKSRDDNVNNNNGFHDINSFQCVDNI